jgi:IclR family transcriptional regulator, acetate operon repressor
MKLLANAREVVSLLADRGPSSPAEIAEVLRIPRPSVYRLVDGLAAVDLVQVDANGQARLHLKWLHLADAARDAMSEWSSARPALDALAERTGLTAFLSVPRPREAVCIDWSPGTGIGVLVLHPGGSLPLHAGGAGRTVLAFGPVDAETLLPDLALPRLSPWTLTTAEELREDVARTRRQGFVHSDQDVTIGIGALAIPLRGGGGELLGALSIAGLAGSLSSAADRDRGLTALHEAAATILAPGG